MANCLFYFQSIVILICWRGSHVYTEENQCSFLKAEDDGRVFLDSFVCDPNGLRWTETDVLKFSLLYFPNHHVFTFSGKVWTHNHTFALFLFLFTFPSV